MGQGGFDPIMNDDFYNEENINGDRTSMNVEYDPKADQLIQ